MDFNVQDPTQRGALFTHLGALVAAEQAYINQRKGFFEAIHFTFPSFLTNPVNDPHASPVTHITDALPAVVASHLPDAVNVATPEMVTKALPSLWSRFRGQHGGV